MAGRKLTEADELEILREINNSGNEGISTPRLTSLLKLSSSTMDYRLKLLLGEHLITRIRGTNSYLYRLVYKGRQRLAELQLPRIVSDPALLEEKKGFVILQNFRIKYPIIQHPSLYFPSTEQQMRNWVKGTSLWKECIEIDTGIKRGEDGRIQNMTSVIFIVRNLVGENEHQLENEAWKIARQHAEMLKHTFKFVFGDPQSMGTQEFEIEDRIARAEIEKYGWVPGVRDRSQTKGEFVFKTADDVSSFRNIHATVSGLTDEVRANHVSLWEEISRQNEIIADQRQQIHALHGKMDQLGQGWLNFMELMHEVKKVAAENGKLPESTGQEVQ